MKNIFILWASIMLFSCNGGNYSSDSSYYRSSGRDTSTQSSNTGNANQQSAAIYCNSTNQECSCEYTTNPQKNNDKTCQPSDLDQYSICCSTGTWPSNQYASCSCKTTENTPRGCLFYANSNSNLCACGFGWNKNNEKPEENIYYVKGCYANSSKNIHCCQNKNYTYSCSCSNSACKSSTDSVSPEIEVDSCVGRAGETCPTGQSPVKFCRDSNDKNKTTGGGCDASFCSGSQISCSGSFCMTCSYSCEGNQCVSHCTE